MGIYHRDLSLKNVLLQGNHCSIVGLGLAFLVPPRPDSTVPALLEPQTVCGSDPQYLAPEIVRNVPFDGLAVDLWAAGIMLCVMLFGTKAPFVWASSEDRGFRKISINRNLRGAMKKWGLETRNNSSVSEEALDLIQNMLLQKPEERLNLDQVMRHPWFTAQASPPDLPVLLRH